MDPDNYGRIDNSHYEALIRNSVAQTQYCYCSKCNPELEVSKLYNFYEQNDCFGKVELTLQKEGEGENIDVFFRHEIEENFTCNQQNRQLNSMQLFDVSEGEYAAKIEEEAPQAGAAALVPPPCGGDDDKMEDLSNAAFLTPEVHSQEQRVGLIQDDDLLQRIRKNARREAAAASSSTTSVVAKRVRRQKKAASSDKPLVQRRKESAPSSTASLPQTAAAGPQSPARNNHHTKNIPKIYGNAFRTYILQSEVVAERQCLLHGVDYAHFLEFVRSKNFYSIKSMRESFVSDAPADSQEAALTRVYRVLVFKFLREEAVTWFLQNKRIGDNKRFCSFRAIIARGIKDPKNFISWDD